jgi:hypothetical protein
MNLDEKQVCDGTLTILRRDWYPLTAILRCESLRGQLTQVLQSSVFVARTGRLAFNTIRKGHTITATVGMDFPLKFGGFGLGRCPSQDRCYCYGRQKVEFHGRSIGGRPSPPLLHLEKSEAYEWSIRAFQKGSIDTVIT